MTRRRFNKSERIIMFLAEDGRCPNPDSNPDCDGMLRTGFHGDHVTAFTNGGPTNVKNGQALCPSCNLKKASK